MGAGGRRKCREKTCKRQQYKNKYCAMHFRQFSGFSTVNFDAVSKGGKFDHNTMKDMQQLQAMTLKINKIGKKKKVMTMASLTARSKRGPGGQKMDLMAMAEEYKREEAKKAALKSQQDGNLQPLSTLKATRPFLAIDSPPAPIKISGNDSRFEMGEMIQVLRSSGAWQDAQITNITQRCFVCQFATAGGLGGTKEIPFSVAIKMLRKKEKKDIIVRIKPVEKKKDTKEMIAELQATVAKLKEEAEALDTQMKEKIAESDFISAGQIQAKGNAVKDKIKAKTAELEKLLKEKEKEESTPKPTPDLETKQNDLETKEKDSEDKPNNKSGPISGQELEKFTKTIKEKLSEETVYKSPNHKQLVRTLSRGEWSEGKQTLQLFSNGYSLLINPDGDVYNVTIGRWNINSENNLVLNSECCLQEKQDEGSEERLVIKGERKSGTMEFTVDGELPEFDDEDEGDLSDIERPPLKFLENNEIFEPSDRSLDPFDITIELSQQ